MKRSTPILVPLLPLLILASAGVSHAATPKVSTADEALSSAKSLYSEGKFFQAARYGFLAGADARTRGEAYSWVTLGLARAGLHNAAAYFFIRTLQEGNQASVRRALTVTESLMERLDGDLFRRYLIGRTQLADYDNENRGAFAYAMGKEALLRGDEASAVRYLDGVSRNSPLWPYALQLRGTAKAIQNDGAGALRDFRACASAADLVSSAFQAEAPGEAAAWTSARREQAMDLEARCNAGVGRTLYQMERFREADKAYDEIPKASFVWTDILFEQAWSAYAQREYNRTLGKLVTYKSPALSFVFNSEVDVLTAQSYLALCLYADANVVINDFNGKYEKVGKQVKSFVDSNGTNLAPYYQAGRKAVNGRLHTKDDFDRLLNRFVRAPYFQRLVAADVGLSAELGAVQRFAAFTTGVSRNPDAGFPGFLEQVLRWRKKTVYALGGAFVRNSLLDYHAVLINDFEKMAFIKLDMLRRAKEKLMEIKPRTANRDRGNVEPSRRDDQYYWSFNGEFWNDEIGDYVFGLESECGT